MDSTNNLHILEEDSSPVKPSDENTAQLTTLSQPVEPWAEDVPKLSLDFWPIETEMINCVVLSHSIRGNLFCSNRKLILGIMRTSLWLLLDNRFKQKRMDDDRSVTR